MKRGLSELIRVVEVSAEPSERLLRACAAFGLGVRHLPHNPQAGRTCRVGAARRSSGRSALVNWPSSPDPAAGASRRCSRKSGWWLAVAPVACSPSPIPTPTRPSSMLSMARWAKPSRPSPVRGWAMPCCWAGPQRSCPTASDSACAGGSRWLRAFATAPQPVPPALSLSL